MKAKGMALGLGLGLGLLAGSALAAPSCDKDVLCVFQTTATNPQMPWQFEGKMTGNPSETLYVRYSETSPEGDVTEVADKSTSCSIHGSTAYVEMASGDLLTLHKNAMTVGTFHRKDDKGCPIVVSVICQ